MEFRLPFHLFYLDNHALLLGAKTVHRATNCDESVCHHSKACDNLGESPLNLLFYKAMKIMKLD